LTKRVILRGAQSPSFIEEIDFVVTLNPSALLRINSAKGIGDGGAAPGFFEVSPLRMTLGCKKGRQPLIKQKPLPASAGVHPEGEWPALNLSKGDGLLDC
jgi:hypothetical protein